MSDVIHFISEIDDQGLKHTDDTKFYSDLCTSDSSQDESARKFSFNNPNKPTVDPKLVNELKRNFATQELCTQRSGKSIGLTVQSFSKPSLMKLHHCFRLGSPSLICQTPSNYEGGNYFTHS